MPAEEDENHWASILDEVQSRSSNNFPQGAVLCLGDHASGKNAIVAHLRHADDVKQGAGLEYQYLEFNPDFKDGIFVSPGVALQAAQQQADAETVRLDVWILDGDSIHSRLMRHALDNSSAYAPATTTPSADNEGPTAAATPPSPVKTLALLCVSLDEPWSILDALKTWSAALDDVISTMVIKEGGAKQLEAAKNEQVKFWQEYVEPSDMSGSDEGSRLKRSNTGSDIPDMSSIALPLGENILTHNLGLPMVVVVTKTDYMSTLEKEYDYKDEHFDFIQYHIRKFCLQYGAALIYTSVKESEL